MKYMIILEMKPEIWVCLDHETQQRIMNDQQGFIDKIRASGEFVSTYALEPPEKSRVVQRKDGDTVVTDGPYVEGKEFLAGFYLVDVVSEERAHELAALVPDAELPGGVQVRKVIFDLVGAS